MSCKMCKYLLGSFSFELCAQTNNLFIYKCIGAVKIEDGENTALHYQCLLIRSDLQAKVEREQSKIWCQHCITVESSIFN